MHKVIIVTGDNTKLIDTIKIEGADVIEYPEVKRHPKEYCLELKNTVINRQNTLLIKTFSMDVINSISDLIEEGYVKSDSIEIKIVTDIKEIGATFDEEGYLENFPIGYLHPFVIE